MVASVGIRLRAIKARVLPRGGFDVLRQLLLLIGVYYAYRYTRGAVDGKAAEAFQNARDLIGIERSLNAFVEPTVQAWSNGQQWTIDFASWMYVNAHFTGTWLALCFIYFFRNHSFYFVRNMFVMAMGIAIAGYILYPTAPPRFLPEWGFTDSVSSFTGIPQTDVTINALFNPFAAVPSMHVGFALLIGWSLARLVRPKPLRIIFRCYPLLVTWVVVATGNHFWLDAFLGACVAALSYLGATRVARLHPDVWSFDPSRETSSRATEAQAQAGVIAA